MEREQRCRTWRRRGGWKENRDVAHGNVGEEEETHDQCSGGRLREARWVADLKSHGGGRREVVRLTTALRSCDRSVERKKGGMCSVTDSVDTTVGWLQHDGRSSPPFLSPPPCFLPFLLWCTVVGRRRHDGGWRKGTGDVECSAGRCYGVRSRWEVEATLGLGEESGREKTSKKKN